QICGLYDLNPSRLGQVDNLRTVASKYGNQLEHHNAIDLTINARVRNGVLLQGGVSTLKSMTDNCDVVTKIDNPSTRCCHAETPFLTEVKFLGSYALPWDFQVAATYTNVPGIGFPATPALGLRAQYVATNAVIAPSLGRNLSTSAFATVPLIEPGGRYVDRLQQVDPWPGTRSRRAPSASHVLFRCLDRAHVFFKRRSCASSRRRIDRRAIHVVRVRPEMSEHLVADPGLPLMAQR